MSAIYIMAWAIVIFALFYTGTLYVDLIKYTSILYGIVIGLCRGALAYEYKTEKECELAMWKHSKAS